MAISIGFVMKKKDFEFIFCHTNKINLFRRICPSLWWQEYEVQSFYNRLIFNSYFLLT